MQVLEFFTNFMSGVSDNPLVDYIACGILVAVAGTIAYKIGGVLGYSGKIGFVLWLITAILVYAILTLIVRFILWLIALPWWVWLIIAVVIVAIVVGIIFIVSKNNE